MTTKPLKIISADERLNAPRGAKILIAGPSGVGKTSLLRGVDPARTLFLDSEAGDLSVKDVPVPTIQIDDWQTARDVAVASADPTHRFRRSVAIHRRTMKQLGDRSKTLTNTT